MREGQYPGIFLGALVAAVCLGILAARAAEPALAPIVLSLALLFLLSAFAIRRGSRWAFAPVWLLFFALGALRFTAAYSLPADDISHFVGETVRIEGRLSAEPRITEDGAGGEKARYEVEVERAARDGAWEKASGKMYLYVRTGETAAIGDRIAARVRVRAPRGYQNPGQLDTPMLLRSSGITAGGTAAPEHLSIEPAAELSLARWAASVRAHYRARMESVMPKEDAAVLFAMLFGGYDGIRPETVELFTTTGIVHILSVSGSHISLLAAAAAYLGLLLRLPALVRAALVLCAIAAYSLLAGFVPPVLRAGLMGALAFLAVALEREREARHILLVAALLLLLQNPLLLFHISFQLSFAATAGLLFLAPCVSRRLAPPLPAFVAMSLSVTVAAQCATLPLLAWYFGRVSLSALFANLVLVPILEGIILLCLAAGILAFFLPFLGTLFFLSGSLLYGIARELAARLAALPYGTLFLPAMGPWSVALYYAALALFAAGGEARRALLARLAPHARPLALCALALLAFAAAPRLFAPRILSVHFIDVGQGDAALIVTPKGRAVLIDAGGTRGGYDIGRKVVLPYLWHFGIRHLDAIFLTHAHEDHAAGAEAVLAAIKTDRVFTAGEGRAAYAHSFGISEADPRLARLSPARTGDRFTIDGVTIETLYAPDVPAIFDASDSGNEASNVYRVTYGKASFLFTGDLVKSQEEALLAAGIRPACTVLKVAHHGSDTSTSEPFLAAAKPRWAVIEVGADNAFGHPKESVLRRLEEAGASICRTDRAGAIRFETDGEKMRVTPYVDK